MKYFSLFCFTFFHSHFKYSSIVSETNKHSEEKETLKMNTESAKNTTAITQSRIPTKARKLAASPAVAKPADGSLHKLRVGDVFLKNGIEHVVWFMNDSRASVSPLTASLQYALRDSDGKPQFLCMDSKAQENVSPNSELKVIRSLGREGLAKFIDENKSNNQVADTMKKSKKKKKETNSTPGIRAGKLGTYEGFSVASVVRALGKAGWNFHEVKAFIDGEKIPASDQSIKLNIYRGVKGVDGEPAPLKTLPKKPKVEAKTKAASPAKKAAKAVAAATKTKNGNGTVNSKAPEKKAEKPSRAADQIAALKKSAATPAPEARA